MDATDFTPRPDRRACSVRRRDGGAAQWDLTVNQAVYTPAHPVALFLEAFGFYPLYLPALLWVCTAAQRAGRTAVRAALWAVCAAGAAGLWAYSAHELAKRGIPSALPCAAVWLVLAALWVWYVRALGHVSPPSARGFRSRSARQPLISRRRPSSSTF